MLHPSTKKLIDRLVEMTALAKIDWKEAEGDKVIYTTEGYSVSLEQEPNEMVITASDGRELERATVDELAEATDADGTPYTGLVAEMTREAFRKAKGIDAAITTLLAGIDLDGDGIPDIPAEPPEAEVETEKAHIDVASPAELEDNADETAAVTAEEIEALDTETHTEMETDASGEERAEPATETNLETEADASINAKEPLQDGPEADMADTSPEDDVTEAVARLADEVNGREEAASETQEIADELELEAAAETIEKTAAEVEANDEPERAVSEQAKSGYDQSSVVFAGVAAAGTGLAATAASALDDQVSDENAETALASDQDFADTAATPAIEEALTAEAVPAPSEEAGVAEEAPEGPTLLEEAAPVAEEATVEVGGAVTGFSIPQTETYIEEALEEPVETTEPEIETVASVSENTEVPSDTAADVAELSDVSASVEIEPIEVVEQTLDEAVSVEEVELEAPVSEAEVSLTEKAEAIAESVEASTAPVEAPISLSGIGAGFGLGALQTTGEASGVPSVEPAAVETKAEDTQRLVIDATQDVALSDTVTSEPDTVAEMGLPDVASIQAVEASGEAITEDDTDESTDADDAISMTPKTRFNPWT